MYQSFTGNSRRPRQVNLSGRNPNPFATTGAPSQGPQQAVKSAHQDRQQRQQQRAELVAAKNLQRTWRGHNSRKKTKDAWRSQWDHDEEDSSATEPYSDVHVSLARLQTLLLFFSAQQKDDLDRLIRYGRRQGRTVATLGPSTGGSWPMAYIRLQRACLAALPSVPDTDLDALLRILTFVADQTLSERSRISASYYQSLARQTQGTTSDAFQHAILQPLRLGGSIAYESFVAAYLTTPHDIASLAKLPSSIDPDLFTRAAFEVTTKQSMDVRSRVWLLGQYIYLVNEIQRTHGSDGSRFDSLEHIPTIARLLACLADDIAPEAPVLDMNNVAYDQAVLAKRSTRVPLNVFLKEQLSHLVDQNAIRSLMVRSDHRASSETPKLQAENAQVLAGYALILLRMFPFRADDIRMWLYLGNSDQTRPGDNVSAIAYFWKGARATSIFGSISHDPHSAVELLKASKPPMSAWQPPAALVEKAEERSSEWRIILIFLELYTFVLKVMDDEEFLGRNSRANTRLSDNALSISDVTDLTVFLKNLGFAMYFNSQEIFESFQRASDLLNPASLSRHFGGSQEAPTSEPEDTKVEQPSVACIVGMSLDYLKGIATGLLRSIYERDSRRNFLPKGHWLMTSRFDMSNFIPSVVEEEARREQVQRQDDEEEADEENDIDSDFGPVPSNNNRRGRFSRERDQRRAHRKRFLEAVAPRLEILQNMPFLIPFDTRVAVFREFVRLDQTRRRNGFVDPDVWRQSVMFRSGVEGGQNELMRHHAKIRRKHEFEDAFEQFYRIGPDLKEPIQITFVDEFDIEEAGIDGGGVTKEFLTSVTSEAFNPSYGLFEENSHHLLYPSPNSFEESREFLLQSGRSEGDPEYRSLLLDLRQRYEFLGRVVGKCLYEGILIDVGFAAFFLSKWALFGGVGAAPKESGYRPTINDLRDLDEELYQGLLRLKYHSGNVEDWSTYFTVTDTIRLPDGKTKTVERELVPGGHNRPVTNENRLLYISSMARWRLSGQSQQQTQAFLKGLSSIVQPSWLSMFNQAELQTLIGGTASSIDVEDLRHNTHYGGLYVIGNDRREHPSIELFWQVMRTMSDEDRRKVLKFVTSTPRAPLLGFGSLNPKFSIRDAGEDESRFPTTSTCVNLLKLPRYKSVDVLRKKLLDAVNSGAGFDLS